MSENKGKTLESPMCQVILKSEIENVILTHSDVNGGDGLYIDAEILKKAGIFEYEKLMICNLYNGERLELVVYRDLPGSGIFRSGGAAARKLAKGDKINIFSFVSLEYTEALDYIPIFLSID
jgi:aspartate 1-decarboxylase